MAKKPQLPKKTILEQVYDYQTRLQGVANDLAVKLAAVVLQTNEPVAKFIATELPKKKRSIKAELDRMEKLIAKVEAIRKPTYDAAKDLILSTSADVVQSGTDETAKEFNKALGEAARKEREQRFCKTLTPQQQSAIIDGQAISGATISDWFKNWKRKDLETISSACQKASIEELTVRDIYRLIRGTKENNFADGVLATTQAGAVTLARTIVNGVANNARVETVKENSDVIDGIKFLGTLDGKTCPYCASLDGYVWRGEDMTHARRPPIHPNCRCTLIPYIELKDDEGNVIDVDSERPAANADFDELAKKAYNENAKQNGWSRRWDDLAPSTRLKYYYQAQKDFEAQTGQKAYDQVPSSLSFADYFKKQSNDFKRLWLGAKRFDLYQQGKLTENQIFAPNLGYMATAADLFQISKADQQTAEELTEIAKEQGDVLKEVVEEVKKQDELEDLRMENQNFGDALRASNFKEFLRDPDEIQEQIAKNTEQIIKSDSVLGFEPQETLEAAESFIKEKFNIDAQYSKKNMMKGIPLNVANDLNQELCRAFNIFGTVGIINAVKPNIALIFRGSFGNYKRETHTISLRPGRGRFSATQYIKKAREGLFSTKSPLHGYRHEIGHALSCYFEERHNVKDRHQLIRELDAIFREYFRNSSKGIAMLSSYSVRNRSEMIAEAIAKIMDGSTNELTDKILKTLLRSERHDK